MNDLLDESVDLNSKGNQSKAHPNEPEQTRLPRVYYEPKRRHVPQNMKNYIDDVHLIREERETNKEKNELKAQEKQKHNTQTQDSNLKRGLTCYSCYCSRKKS